jgi:hypothetical protein
MGYLFEMAAVTAKGLEQIADQSLRGASGPPQPLDVRPWSYPVAPSQPVAVPVETPPGLREETIETRNPPELRQFPELRTREESAKMPDTNLNDDMVKLVEFTIVTIERGRERLLEGPRQVIVTDDLTGNAFSNARIADWVLKEHGDRSVKTDTLRVYYNVLDRWPKEDLKADERKVDAEEDQARYLREQITVLREIADKIGSKHASQGPGPVTPPASSHGGKKGVAGTEGSPTP